MCAPDYHRSSLARFKRSKTVKVKKFSLFKKLNKTPLIRHGYTVTTVYATPVMLLRIFQNCLAGVWMLE